MVLVQWWKGVSSFLFPADDLVFRLEMLKMRIRLYHAFGVLTIASNDPFVPQINGWAILCCSPTVSLKSTFYVIKVATLRRHHHSDTDLPALSSRPSDSVSFV